MHPATVGDLMVPTSQCVTVGEEATLRDAFFAQQACLDEGHGSVQRPARGVLLVLDPQGRIVGRLTPEDILRGLDSEVIRHSDPLSMIDGLENWDRPLAHLAIKARYLKVGNLLRPLAESDTIEEQASLDQALRQLVDHHLSSLIVIDQATTTGVLTSIDVFCHVCRMVAS